MTPDERAAPRSRGDGAKIQDDATVPCGCENVNTGDDLAAVYAASGFAFFPCRLDKTPAIKNWQTRATSDPEEIRALIGKTSRDEISLGMVVPKGVLAVDIDSSDALAALRESAPQGWSPGMEKAPIQLTGRGVHVLYRLPAGAFWGALGTSSAGLPKGIDIRANGKGYLIVGPSLHRETGRRYLWRTSLKPVHEIPELPAWLQNLLLPAEAPTEFEKTAATKPSSGDAARLSTAVAWAAESVRQAEPNMDRNNSLNLAAFTVAGIAAAEGLPLDDARERLAAAALEAGLEPEEIQRTIESGFSKGAKKPLPAQDARPTINTSDELHVVVKSALHLLPSVGDLYQRAGHLVRCIRIKASDTGDLMRRLKTDEATASTWVGSPILRTLSPTIMRFVLSEACQWKKWDSRAKQLVPTTPSRDIAQTLCELGEYCGVPPVVRIAEAPFMRPDGSICDTPGYDPSTGYLYEPTVDFPQVPATPTRAQATEAYKQLEAVFCDFPFVSREHAGVPVAVLLSILARPMVGNVPAFLIEASAAGTGKTLVADVVSVAATGRPAPKLSWPPGREWRRELDQVLAAVAVDASPLVSFDNVPSTAKVGGAGLDKVLTCNGSTKFRTLGKTEAPELPWNTVVILNGNNSVATIQDETKRRILPCRMVSDVERPQERGGFVHPDLLPWARENRGQLVAAALTVLRHWVIEGRKARFAPWGSFETWSRAIPSAIALAGGPAILSTRAMINETVDEDEAAAVNLFKAIYEHHPKGATAQELATKVDNYEALSTSSLSMALTAAVGQDFTPRKVGCYLSCRRDRILRGYQLKGRPGHARQVEWRVILRPESAVEGAHERDLYLGGLLA